MLFRSYLRIFMEESKELQGFYKIFRAVIYISVLMEFFEYAIDPVSYTHLLPSAMVERQTGDSQGGGQQNHQDIRRLGIVGDCLLYTSHQPYHCIRYLLCGDDNQRPVW